MVGDVPDAMLKILLSLLMTTTYFTDVKGYNIVLQLPNFIESENLTIEDYDIENRNSTNTDNNTDYFYIDYSRIGYQMFKSKMDQAMKRYESFMKMNPVILKVDKTNLSNNGTINLTILNNNITENVYESVSGMQQKPETNTESPLNVDDSTEDYDNTVQHFLESSNFTQTPSNYNFTALETSERNKTDGNEINQTTNNEEYTTESYYINNTTSVGENKTTNNEEYTTANLNLNNITYSVTNKTDVEDNTTASSEANQTLINQENKNVSSEANKTISDGAKNTEVVPVGFFDKISNTVTNIFNSLTTWF